MDTSRPLTLGFALLVGCASPSTDPAPTADGGSRGGGDASSPGVDASSPEPGVDAFVARTDGGAHEHDLGSDPGVDPDMGSDPGGDPDLGPPPACGAGGFRPMVAYDGDGEAAGADFLAWRRSVYDDSRSVSQGRSVRVSTNPGPDALPACSGGHFFAGRTRLPTTVPQGSTLWFRIYQYIPSTFSFGYKYSRAAGDRDIARACGQYADGNLWLKWLVLAPHHDFGTARIYLSPTAARRTLTNPSPQVRLISEALHRPHDEPVDLPRDRWFALQMAVRVSDGDDGFIRAWIDDQYLGEVTGRTTVADAPIHSWGMGDYWNGVPWTDGAPGRTDFWVDEVIVASDAPGYDAPTGIDSGGRRYIDPCTRVADLTP